MLRKHFDVKGSILTCNINVMYRWLYHVFVAFVISAGACLAQ